MEVHLSKCMCLIDFLRFLVLSWAHCFRNMFLFQQGYVQNDFEYERTCLCGELRDTLEMTNNNWNRVWLIHFLMTWVIVFHALIESLSTCHKRPHLLSSKMAPYHIQFRMSSCICRIIIDTPTQDMLYVYFQANTKLPCVQARPLRHQSLGWLALLTCSLEPKVGDPKLSQTLER